MRELWQPRSLAVVIVSALLMLLAARPEVWAQPADPPAPDGRGGGEGGLGGSAVGAGGEGGASSAGAIESEEVAGLRLRREAIEALLRSELDVATDPQTLFDVPLDDEVGIAIAVRRLRAVLAAERDGTGGAGGDGGEGGEGGGEGGDGGAGGMAGAADRGEVEPVIDAARLDAQLALDAVTLEFLGLPEAERARILASHRTRQNQASEEERRLNDAEKKRREAELARKRAEEAAAAAESEVRRRIENERARLLRLIESYSEREAALLKREQALEEQRERRLAWQRNVESMLSRIEAGDATQSEVDAFYDRLAAELSEHEHRLSSTLDVFSSRRTTIEPLGDSPLVDLDEADRVEVAALRVEALNARATLVSLERRVLEAEAGGLAKHVRALNRQRLSLLPHLSADKREALHGFGPVGRRQAEAELARVLSILRFHVWAAVEWWRQLDVSKLSPDQRLDTFWLIFEIVAALLVFIWIHRRSGAFLTEMRDRELERARTKRREPGRSVPLLRFVLRIRRPAEWLIFFFVVRAIVPTRVAELLELQLLGITLWWTFGEALVVDVIDALFARRRYRTTRDEELSKLRLRALHLVGRVVVLFGLTLSLVLELVGEGTIYHWLWRLAAAVSVPVVLLLVRWYKPHIFARVKKRQRSSAIARWVADREAGFFDFIAAMVGAVYLVGRGVDRFVRTYVLGFDLSRRLLAYWFRRELAKKDEELTRALAPLERGAHELLSPDAVADPVVEDMADGHIERVVECILAPGGGVFAVVGERGSGKSTLLRRIEARTKARILHCPLGSAADFTRALKRQLDLPDDASLGQVRDIINGWEDDTAILVDDAHHLVRPVIGGLDDFDAILGLARDASLRACTWVFALDSVIWQFFQSARGARPIFDDVVVLSNWSEEGIARLLADRSKGAGVEARFDRLLTEVASDADEVDRAEALTRSETNYYRLLWDYADGNPGVALHFWRESLGVDDDGIAWVRLFSPPTTADIEQLPDEALFVLRAVVQLEMASVPDIVAATMLTASRVNDALRYARSRGYVETVGARYRVSWQWFRAITTFLERRHLLVRSRA